MHWIDINVVKKWLRKVTGSLLAPQSDMLFNAKHKQSMPLSYNEASFVCNEVVRASIIIAIYHESAFPNCCDSHYAWVPGGQRLMVLPALSWNYRNFNRVSSAATRMNLVILWQGYTFIIDCTAHAYHPEGITYEVTTIGNNNPPVHWEEASFPTVHQSELYFDLTKTISPADDSTIRWHHDFLNVMNGLYIFFNARLIEPTKIHLFKHI